MVFVELYSQPVFRVDNLLRHEEVAGPVGFCPWLVVFLLHREGPHEGGCRWDSRDDAVPGWLGLEAAGLELARSDLVDADGAETTECIHCDLYRFASRGRGFCLASRGGWLAGLRRVGGRDAGEKCVGCGTRCTLDCEYMWEQQQTIMNKTSGTSQVLQFSLILGRNAWGVRAPVPPPLQVLVWKIGISYGGSWAHKPESTSRRGETRTPSIEIIVQNQYHRKTHPLKSAGIR